MIVDLVLGNVKAYVNKEIVDCCLAIDNGKILRIGRETNMPQTEAKIDLRNLLVLPGLIDSHVHLRDEDKAYKEDFYSGTAAAAAGGMTTVLDMPNNEPVTMTAETLHNRMKAAEQKILVNVGFYSEFPKNTQEIGKIVSEGAVAFKLFMAEQVGGLNVDDDETLLKAFRIVNELERQVNIHAEDRITLEKAEEEFRRQNRNDIQAFLEAHSETAEIKAITRILDLVKRVNVNVHFCHITTEKGLKAITNAKKARLPVTCEATPHHLFLSDEDLKRIGTLAITMPPVREKRQKAALWKGIRNGLIDLVASDHAPHALEEKMARTVWKVKVGVPGLETSLALLLTEVKKGKLSIGDIVRLMSETPAKIFKLEGKGFLKEGNDADLTVVDLKRKYRIDAAKFRSKAKYSPFDGRITWGKAVKTFVSGQLIMDEGEITAKPRSGKIIRRE